MFGAQLARSALRLGPQHEVWLGLVRRNRGFSANLRIADAL